MYGSTEAMKMYMAKHEDGDTLNLKTGVRMCAVSKAEELKFVPVCSRLQFYN